MILGVATARSRALNKISDQVEEERKGRKNFTQKSELGLQPRHSMAIDGSPQAHVVIDWLHVCLPRRAELID